MKSKAKNTQRSGAQAGRSRSSKSRFVLSFRAGIAPVTVSAPSLAAAEAQGRKLSGSFAFAKPEKVSKRT